LHSSINLDSVDLWNHNASPDMEDSFSQSR